MAQPYSTANPDGQLQVLATPLRSSHPNETAYSKPVSETSTESSQASHVGSRSEVSTGSRIPHKHRSVVSNAVTQGSDALPSAHSIHNLPPELLSEIFIHCLPTQRFPKPRIRQAPMLLCQVCSFWRRVALSVAVLWSSFDFVLTYETKWSHVALLQRWLTRSRTHPISFSLIPTRRAATLRKALFANVQRWRHIQFRLDAELGQDFLKIDGEQAHLLERVSMTIDPRNWEDERLPSVLASFPCLHHLQWTGKYIPATFVNTLWPRLSHIKLVACVISTSDFLALLSHCPTVEHIEAHRPLKSLGSPRAGPCMTIPNLQSLAFWADDPGEILDNLTLPCLRSLTTQPPRDPKALQRLDYRSSCKLEAFEMTDYGLTDDDALLYLRLPCMQSLHSLKLGSGAVTNRLVELLTWKPSSHADRVCALPSLTHLTLNMWKTTDGKVGEMISSRWHPDDHYSDHSVSLMDVDLDYEPDDYLIEGRLISKGVEHHAVDFARFEQLAAHGLEITWHCSCFTSWDYIRT